MELTPVTLTGSVVRLEPFSRSHVAGAMAASAGTDVFRYFPFALTEEEHWLGFIDAASRLGLLFATCLVSDGTVIGSTGFWAADATHRRVEIGATWLTPAAQRTAANTESKLLMLSHAFDVLGCRRVEFKTDSRNVRSRAALSRIGATEEGTLRHHMLLWDGSDRDSVYFSVLAEEWTEVKARLLRLLER